MLEDSRSETLLGSFFVACYAFEDVRVGPSFACFCSFAFFERPGLPLDHSKNEYLFLLKHLDNTHVFFFSGEDLSKRTTTKQVFRISRAEAPAG